MNRPPKTIEPNATSEPRSSRMDHLFPQGLPCLWCDMLTHYTGDGQIDWPRMEAYLNYQRPSVTGFLVAGHAGDGHKLSPAIRKQLTAWASDQLKPRKEFLLTGTSCTAALQNTLTMPAQNNNNNNNDNNNDNNDKPTSFVGLWIDAVEAVEPDNNGDAATHQKQLAQLLQKNLPTAVSLNATSNTPKTANTADAIASLASRFENLLYIGDATHDDQLAKNTQLPAGVFRLRTAQGDYTRLLASNGGPYHGLLLPETGLFPKAFHDLTLAPALGKWDESHAMTSRLSNFFDDVISLFKNTRIQAPDDQNHSSCQNNQRLYKAIDHHMAHGPSACDAPSPTLHDKQSIPDDLLKAVGELLNHHDFAPQAGYLP